MAVAKSESAKETRTGRAAETRDRILQIAIELIAERGYSGTSVANVCTRAGVAAPALYFHFGNKEGLLGAVIDRVGNAWIDELETRIYVEDAGLDPLQRAANRLKRALDGYRTLIVEQPQMLRVLLLVALERSDQSPAIRTALRRFGRRAIDAVARGIQDSVDRPLPDLDLVGHTVISLLEGALIRTVVDPDGTDLDRLWGELAETIALAIAHRTQHVTADEG